jgi:beta-galactosidase GanA
VGDDELHAHATARCLRRCPPRDLDIVTWTLYPVHGDLGEGPLGFRLGDGTAISFMATFARSINGHHGLMELQPGQVNWGSVNPLPLPGAVRSWILRTFALGSELLCTYRYRQPFSATSSSTTASSAPDGVTLTRGGEEYVQAIREIRRLRELRPPLRRNPPLRGAAHGDPLRSRQPLRPRQPPADRSVGTPWATCSVTSARSSGWGHRWT